ncbi:MAG: hypothetical protein GY851_07610 [bacterium]|nr:hypothetical protein [bacterium]
MTDGRKGIDYRAIANEHVLQRKRAVAREQFNEAAYVSVSDAMVNITRGGEVVLEKLGAESRTGIKDKAGVSSLTNQRAWKLRVLCDRWGMPVKPGDVIKYKADLTNKDEDGNKLTSRDIKDMKRRGAYNLVTTHALVVDDRGCLTALFEDASKLLKTHGVHYVSGEPITGLKELSGALKDAPDGSKKHVHNWRYVEVPPWEYDELPNIKPKRKTRATNPKPAATGGKGKAAVTAANPGAGKE